MSSLASAKPTADGLAAAVPHHIPSARVSQDGVSAQRINPAAGAAVGDVAEPTQVVDISQETAEERTERFVREVGPLQTTVLRFARSFTAGFADPVEDAHDIAQTALQKAFASFHTFRPGSNLTGWLHRIVRNTAINEVRRRQRRVTESLGLDAFDDGDEGRLHERPENLTASAEIEALDRCGDPEITRALQSLPEDRRTVVYLACVEQMAYKEIAEIMGTPVGTVMSRLSRGRKELRAQLAQVALERGIKTAAALTSADKSENLS